MADSTKPYTVLSPLRLDRLYGIGEVVELGDVDAKELMHLLAIEPAERKPVRVTPDAGEGPGLTPQLPATGTPSGASATEGAPAGEASKPEKTTTTKAAKPGAPKATSGKGKQGK